jgi:hypothetical protein
VRPNDPRVIARHESAHALVLIARNVKFESIEVFTEPAYVEEADAVAGGCIKMRPRVFCLGDELLTRTISCLASLPVERMLRRDIPYGMLALTSCANDYSDAEEECKRNGFDINRLQTVANKMVRRLSPSIRKLGNELLRRGRMTYQQVLEFCPEVAAEGRAFRAAEHERALAFLRNRTCGPHGVSPLAQ